MFVRIDLISVIVESDSCRAVMTMFILVVSDDLPRKKLPQIYKPPTPELLAYLDFSVSTTGILAGVKVSSIHHKASITIPVVE